jgi:hypothetical protein
MTGVLTPRVIYSEHLPLFGSDRGADSSARDTYGLEGRRALRDPCPSAAGHLELVCLAQAAEVVARSGTRRLLTGGRLQKPCADAPGKSGEMNRVGRHRITDSVTIPIDE